MTYEPVRVTWAGDETDPIFDAVADRTQRWNGWLAAPFFDRENVQRLMDYNNAAMPPEEIDQFHWDGDNLVQVYFPDPYRGDDPDREVHEPKVIDGVMRWAPGAFSWTWTEVEEQPKIRIVLSLMVELDVDPIAPARDIVKDLGRRLASVDVTLTATQVVR